MACSKLRPSVSGLFSLAGVSFVSSLAFGAPRMPTHVACVGDSITYGYGASNPATKSYPANLQALFGASVQVKTCGHNVATMLSAPFGDLPYGDQSEYSAATSFVSGAGASAVVDVIIMLGTNDSKSFNWSPANKPKNDQQFLSDYRALVEHFSGLPTKPLVFLALPLSTGNSPCCSIDGTVIHDEVVPLIKQLATEKHLPTIDLNTKTAGHPEYFGDGVHPTDAAYALVAQWMHDGLLIDQSSGGAGAGGGSGAGAGSGGSGAGSGGVGGGSGGMSSAGGSARAGNGGIDGSTSGGAAGSAIAGSGPLQTAGGGASAGGAPSAGGASTGGTAALAAAGANASGGSKSAPAQDNSSGCTVSGGSSVASSLAAFGWLGLGLLAFRRRRVRG